MKKFSLKAYAESYTSAPELLGDISTDYGRKQIVSIAEFNGLSKTTEKVSTDFPFEVDYRTAQALEFIYDTLEEYGGECYTTECGEVYAVKSGNDYGWLDNQIDDLLWDELSSYGEGAENE